MIPKIKKDGDRWIVFHWDIKYLRIYDTWEEAIQFAISLKRGYKGRGRRTLVDT
jgi:hypothetical protein